MGGLLALAAVTGAGPAAASTSPAVRPVALPRDHGAHPGFQVEWWYTAGTVRDAAGHRYFWFATVWSAAQGLVARANVVDLGSDRVVLSREYVSATPVSSGQTRMPVGAFRLQWLPARTFGRWSITAAAGSATLNLGLSAAGPYVRNGPDGIIQQGPGGPSAYYSAPRLAARGSLELHGRRIALSGEGWLDHQWGNFIGNPGALRWNWFACQLRDGRDLMLYQFLNGNGRPSGYRAGTLVGSHGSITHPSRFTVTPLAPFVRPAGASTTYPLRWHLAVPAAKLDVTLRALARNQFIVNRFVPSFWEGAAAITTGSAGGCIVESARQSPATSRPAS